MKAIYKYALAATLAGTMAVAAVTPGEARGGRNAAAAIGFGASATGGAAQEASTQASNVSDAVDIARRGGRKIGGRSGRGFVIAGYSGVVTVKMRADLLRRPCAIDHAL